MNTPSYIILGPGIVGTNFIRRYRVCGGNRTEIAPRLLLPRPCDPARCIEQARGQAAAAGYAEFVLNNGIYLARSLGQAA